MKEKSIKMKLMKKIISGHLAKIRNSLAIFLLLLLNPKAEWVVG